MPSINSYSIVHALFSYLFFPPAPRPKCGPLRILALFPRIKKAPREDLNPLEPSPDIILENPFHKSSRKARQVVIGSR
jgi:hypothetical protein